MAAPYDTAQTNPEPPPTRREENPTINRQTGFFSAPTLAEPAGHQGPAPEMIGRYEIRQILGEGAYGRVYHAHDPQLDRAVALKIPNQQLFATAEGVAEFLAEARTAARLKHEGLVAVYDVQLEGQRPYIVQELINGPNLSQAIKTNRPTPQVAVGLLIDAARAVGYAHDHGFVHRDLKPGNILVDSVGRAHVADFGLAVHESRRQEKEGEISGTPAYMSPEQVRGESHRLDGRTDIWSLGVILYEMLAGRRPFQADTNSGLFVQITTSDPVALRQLDPSVPPELERICLKCLARRKADRYASATELVDDLQHWQELDDRKTPQDTTAVDEVAIQVVPKGLRSFDEHDADFFLHLLPGPRDRNGLPESIHFWKTRLEETAAEETFPVGLLYGPSGCGKSSLVKAGLLPRLAEHVAVVYVEATSDDSESRLIEGLRQRFAELPAGENLSQTLQRLREQSRATKVLLVLDQFEQWLHAHAGEETSQLASALRHCDGGHVQCLLLVRDDFWLAVSRFMSQLEVELSGDRNTALVDLFDLPHARRVLAAFGRAMGRLPESPADVTADHEEFLHQATSGLADTGKIVSVRLALFAQMMKDKPWMPETLVQVGGTRGLGLSFLEETFASPAADARHRRHQKAAQAVLRALLPEPDAQIRGQRRSHHELLAASGYAKRLVDFEDLIRILDSELRLITPVDSKDTSERCYQLTHDYLVHSLRDWLASKQRETYRGRAELALADRASLWNTRPDTRHLPSLREYLGWLVLTDRRRWSPGQTKMMNRAARVHGIRSGLAAVVLAIVVLGAWQIMGRYQAASLVKQLGSADIGQTPAIVQSLAGYRSWANSLLEREFQEAEEGSLRKLRAALALLPADSGKAAYLQTRLLDARPDEFVVMRDALAPHQQTIVEPLWDVAQDVKAQPQARFQATCALATFAPSDQRWQSVSGFAAERLLTLESSQQVAWRTALRPASANLVESLAAIYRRPSEREQVRAFAAETLADYEAQNPRLLFDLLADAEPYQFAVVQSRIQAHKTQTVALGVSELAKKAPDDSSDEDKERLARRQANAAMALFNLDASEQVWPLLRHGPDPRARSYFIHWPGPREGVANRLIERLDQEQDASVRRAILLTLGDLSPLELPDSERGPLIEKLLAMFEHETDAGLHAAAGWLLIKWGHQERRQAIFDKLRANEKQVHEQMAAKSRGWYVNTQGQTFVIVEPGEFLMGSPESEPDRKDLEVPHRRKLLRRFAIASHEVTKGQFAAFQKARGEPQSPEATKYVKTDDSPRVGPTWYEAVAYCNWLSKEEGLTEDQWCYVPNFFGSYAAGMRVKANAGELLGYRLPSEAEWEYACRAGAVTSRYYGRADSLLPRYAWQQSNGQNRLWPVGTLAPNEFGLFDMLGNAFEWCHDPLQIYPDAQGRTLESPLDVSPPDDRLPRVLRGGSFLDPPPHVRCAYRNGDQPNNRNGANGFRVARSL